MKPQHPFRFCLLGSVQIEQWRDGQWLTVEAPPKRTHPLLTLLLLRPEPLGRDLLADLLFPQRLPHKGRQRVRDLLWLIGNALPDLTLVQSREHVHLPAPVRWLDVEAFFAASERNELTAWQQAIDLYGGELASWDVRWLEQQANRLQMAYVRLLHQVTRTLFEQSQFAAGVVYAQQLFDSEPFDEEALRLLMRYRQVLGQRGAGLTAYQSFAKSAETHLGIQPDPRTQKLAEALQAGLPAERAAADVVGNPLRLLISRAVAALEQANVEQVTVNLNRLQAFVRAGTVPPDLLEAICYLRIDLACLQMELPKAQRLLHDCPSDTIETQLRQAWIWWRQKSAAALPLIQRVLVAVAVDGEPSRIIRAHLLFAHLSAEMDGNFPRAVRALDKATRLARRINHHRLLTEALIVKAKLAFLQQKAEALQHTAQEALTLAETYQLRLQRFQAYDWLVAFHKSVGDFATAQQVALQSLVLAQEMQIPFYVNQAQAMLALTYLDMCDYERAIRLFQSVRDYYEQQGDDYNRARMEYCLGGAMLESLQHSDEAALDHARIASDLMRQGNAVMLLPVMLEGQGLIHYRLDQFDAVLACAEEILSLSREHGLINSQVEGLWLKAAGLLGKGEAIAARQVSEEMMVELSTTQFDQRARPSRYWLHALTLAATGDAQDGQRYLREAVTQIHAIAETMADPQLRQSYLNEVMNRRVLDSADIVGIR